MPRLSQQFAWGEFEKKLDAWSVRLLTTPAKSRRRSTAIVAFYVLAIGAADYFTGTTLSLQVFYLVPIACAVIWLGFFEAFVTSVCSIAVRVGGDYVQGAAYTRRPSIFWNMLAFLAIYLVVALILQALIRLRRELEARVESRTDALAEEIRARARLQQELLGISERERRAIGNDLHDGLGQHLTAMAFAAGVMSRQIAAGDGRAAGTALEIVRLAEDSITQSRQLARGLLLMAIEPAQLNRELEELASSVQRQTGVRCHYATDGRAIVSDTTTASHLFRIAQEAVRNSLRHAQPTAVTLHLREEEGDLVLLITDNGTGLPQTANEKAGVGLGVMEHRARALGGEFSLRSSPDSGTEVRCRVPVVPARLAPL